MTTDQFNMAKKYPFIFQNDSDIISLQRVSYYLEIIQLEKNDESTLELLGLKNYLKDIKYIFSDIKETRREKLEKLKKINDSI